MRDPGFRGRLLKALAFAMLIAAVFGIPAGFAAYLIPSQTPSTLLGDALFLGGNAAAIVFWVAFILMFVTQVYRTDAMLDMDRRVRKAEELFQRGGPRR